MELRGSVGHLRFGPGGGDVAAVGAAARGGLDIIMAVGRRGVARRCDAVFHVWFDVYFVYYGADKRHFLFAATVHQARRILS